MRKTRRFRSEVRQAAILGLLLSYPMALAFGADAGATNSRLPFSSPARNNIRRPARKTSTVLAAKLAKAVQIKPIVVAPGTDKVLALLKANLARQEALLGAQQEQMAQLRAEIDEQKQRLDRTEQEALSKTQQAPGAGQLASLSPVTSGSAPPNGRAPINTVPIPLKASGDGGPSQQQIDSYSARVDSLSNSVALLTKGVAGLKFSGDFRLRADGDYRSGNSISGPVQNSRGRYRVRAFIDKNLSDQFDLHLAMGSGRSDNGLTSDSDFTGFDLRAPLYIVEASAGYHPNESLSLRGGKLPEVFADDSRFLFKEEIRFNGFQEIVRRTVPSNPLGVTSIEFRGGQYVLTNPNVPVLPSAKACTAAAQAITKLPANLTPPAASPANCAYLNAGYAPGSNLRDADLFHQGFVIAANLKPGWRQQLSGDLQLWRNPSQVALAATGAGFGVALNAYPGFALAGPITGTGTATTTPGGAIFTAAHFQIAHIHYGIGYEGLKIRAREMPLTFDFHASRNLGAGFLRDAVMGIASFGETRKAGDVHLLYAYAIKDGNSMISEVTDDYVGSLSGVNIKTQEIRFDLGLTKFLAWQNYVYIVNPRRPSDPTLHFYVPIPSGANAQYRVQSQLQFKF